MQTGRYAKISDALSNITFDVIQKYRKGGVAIDGLMITNDNGRVQSFSISK
jgi:hypothetical protein